MNYYYYYLYTKILIPPQPFFVTLLAISFLQSLLINSVLSIAVVSFYCTSINKWHMISVWGVILVVNYFYFYKSERGVRLVKNKPVYFGSNKLTVFFVILVSIIIISWLFWGSFYSRYILSECE